jgi:uncharacterized protein (DUF1800 family)
MSAAVVAAARFGLGARAGELERIGRDPQGWVLAQLGRKPAVLAGDLPASHSMVALMLEARRRKGAEDRGPLRRKIRDVYHAEVAARIDRAVATDAPLVERLTHFWSNHFTVSGLRPVVRGFDGAFEREAIRPHVLGNFADLLLAAERHPAMLFYLDNVQSIGPHSLAGQRRGKGLNENLGREILELHTLGVDGGYTQADVEALARILTGWTIARLDHPAPGRFVFDERLHEPGPKPLLGRRYAEAGLAEGEAALRDLAHHPATARHLARKLARHFIADEPPADAVARIAAVFADSGGDLRRVIAAVAQEEAPWRTPFAKVRTPLELVIAACRAGGFVPRPEMLVNSLRRLDQPSFFAPSPAGWPDTAAAWVSPEAVLQRAEWCALYAQRIPDPPEPMAVAEASFGAALPIETTQAIGRAATRRDGLALLFVAPEFQRR